MHEYKYPVRVLTTFLIFGVFISTFARTEEEKPAGIFAELGQQIGHPRFRVESAITMLSEAISMAKGAKSGESKLALDNRRAAIDAYLEASRRLGEDPLIASATSNSRFVILSDVYQSAQRVVSASKLYIDSEFGEGSVEPGGAAAWIRSEIVPVLENVQKHLESVPRKSRPIPNLR